MAFDTNYTNQDFKVVGQRVRRLDGIDKVTGRAKYGADAFAPGQLVGLTLRSPHAAESGGLSGAPLFERATHVLAAIAGRLPADGPALVGVGGVASGWQAYAKILVGASLVQLYSGLALEGPELPGRVVRELARLLRADGHDSIAAARGSIPDAGEAIQHALRLAQSA